MEFPKVNKYLISLCPVQGVRVGGGHQIIDSRVARRDSCWIQIIDVKLGGSVTDSSLGLNCPPIRETKSQWPIQVKGEQHIWKFTPFTDSACQLISVFTGNSQLISFGVNQHLVESTITWGLFWSGRQFKKCSQRCIALCICIGRLEMQCVSIQCIWNV